MHITLFAAAGAHNLGDECIILAEYRFLRERHPDAIFHIHTYDPVSTILPDSDDKIRYERYFPNALRKHPIKNLFALLNTIITVARSELVVIGGGGIFYDNEAGQSFSKQVSQWTWRANLARFFGAKLVFFGIGIDVREENQSKLLPIFQTRNPSKTLITVRDPKSAKILESIGISSTITPDPAFMTEPVRIKSPSGKKKIGVSLRKGYLKNESENIQKLLDIAKIAGYEIVFLNHSFHPDNQETDDSAFTAPWEELYGASSTKTIHETYQTYRDLSFVIAMRLHAGVLSAVNGVPFFLISYSKKTDEFARKIGHEYILSAKTFDFNIYKTRFLALIENAESESFALTKKCDIIRAEANLLYSELFDGLERN